MTSRSEATYIHVRNFARYTHYKTRRLRWDIWIKEYATQLREDGYLDLSFAQRGILHGLRLLYAVNGETGIEISVARRYLATNRSDHRYFRGHIEALEEFGFIELSTSREPNAAREDLV